MRTRLLALSLTVALAVGLGAVPAGAETVVVPTPVPAGATTTSPEDVACASASVCFAVGYAQGTSTGGFLMRGNGTTWTTAPTPVPSVGATTGLLGVACPSTTACFAVGTSTPSGALSYDPLAMRWNGSTWSIMALPTLAPSSPEGRIYDVDCLSATDCWAVGSFWSAASSDSVLILRWNGTAWSKVTTPTLPAGADYSGLHGVTCVTAAVCWAVGYGENGTHARAIVLRWNGTAWSVSPNPTPTSGTNSDLSSVACGSATQCFAVGRTVAAAPGTSVNRLVLRWNGTAWATMSTPVPSGATNTALDDIDCVGTSACWSVGKFTASGVGTRRFVLRWNGSAWAIASTPLPTANTETTLRGVSCVTAVNCWTVGTSTVDGIVFPFFVRLGDVPAPSPAVVPTPVPADSTDTYLRDVWCVTATSCWAVGAATIGGTGTRMVMRSAGNTWGLVNTPTLPGTLWSTFMGVTCTSATDCWAVGYAQIGSVNRPLIVRWNGTAWSLVTAPATDDATLESVACTSTTNCWSVGTIRSDGVPDTRLVLRWNGTTWTPFTTALPSGTTSSDLHDVTCTGASACWAVGGFVGAAGPRRLILRWNGTSWTVVTTPLPSGSTDSFAASVSCGSSTSCVVAGGAFVSGAPRQMILRWNGSTWTADTVPAVSGSEATIFFGVSCATATTCTAVGAIQIAGVVRRSFARWNGTAWTHIATPLPTGTVRSEMGGISCTGATACTGVGMSRVGYDHALVIRIS